MTAERWGQLREFLDRVLDHPEQKVQIMKELREQNSALCDDLERVVKEFEEEDDSTDLVRSILPDPLGQRIGPYQIEAELGRGGMGTVFLAMREESGIRVPVALKFLRQHLLESPNRAFRREWRVLVRLNHPNIARLLDWGTSPSGLLYLAIEYVDGKPITRYCQERHLGLRSRLALFLQICTAVQHAHQNLVVHRDLKPSNILVTADGVVKLLDFGIARELDASTLVTTVLRNLTPGYASPEQIRGQPVTVLSDVYSLGVLLYEMVSGQMPYQERSKNLLTSLDEMPLAPSKRASLPEISGRELSGDLDSITLKAIRNEADQRYTSVEQLAADLERYLNGFPVAARGGARLYIARRFIDRYRIGIALACFALLSLLAGTTLSVWNWRASEKSLVIAESRYKALRSFAKDVIFDVDARTTTSVTDTQRKISATATRYLDQLRRERVNDDELQQEIADSYQHLGHAQGEYMNPNEGDPIGALSNFQKAHAIYLAQWKEHPDTLHGLRLVDIGLDIAGVLPDPVAAVASLSEAISVAEQLMSSSPRDLGVLNAGASVYGIRGQRRRDGGGFSAALEDFGRAIEISNRALLGSAQNGGALLNKETFTSETATVRRLEGDFSNALQYAQQAREIALQALQLESNPKTRRQAAFKSMMVAETLRRLKRYPEAMPYAQSAVQELRSIAEKDTSNEQAELDLALSYFRLGDLEMDQGRIMKARQTHGESMRLRRDTAVRSPFNYLALKTYAVSLNCPGTLGLQDGGDPAVASEYFKKAASVVLQSKSQMPSDVYFLAELARAYYGSARVAMHQKNRLQASELIQGSIRVWQDVRKRCPLDVDFTAEEERTARFLKQITTESSDLT